MSLWKKLRALWSRRDARSDDSAPFPIADDFPEEFSVRLHPEAVLPGAEASEAARIRELRDRVDFVRHMLRRGDDAEEIIAARRRGLAVYLTDLGVEETGQVFKQLFESETEDCARALVSLEEYDSDEVEAARKAEQKFLTSKRSLFGSGLNFVHAAFSRAFSMEAATRLLHGVSSHHRTEKPFALLSSVHDDFLVTILANEHPQTAAVILSRLPPDRSARLLARFSDAEDYFGRIRSMRQVGQEYLAEIERVLERKISLWSDEEDSAQWSEPILKAAEPELRERLERSSQKPQPPVRTLPSGMAAPADPFPAAPGNLSPGDANFANLTRISREAFGFLTIMQETFFTFCVKSLFSRLTPDLEWETLPARQIRMGDWLAECENPTLIARINMDPLKGTTLLKIDPAIYFPLIDSLLGGTGRPEVYDRALTDIELNIMEGVIVRLLGNLRPTWSTVLDLKPRLGNIETIPAFARIANDDEWMGAFGQNLRLGRARGRVQLVYHLNGLAPILPRLKPWTYYERPQRNQLELDDTPVSIELGLQAEAVLRGRQLRRLKPGDTILFGPAEQADRMVLNAGGERLAAARRDETGLIRDFEFVKPPPAETTYTDEI